jgi:nicotinamide mononucleotide transporter
VGLILLARKYIEQWIAWVVVDVICVVLFIYKGIYLTAGLYALYTVLAIYGYYVWKQKMEADE